MGNFHPLEVVGRGSETQPQVGENYMFKVAYDQDIAALLMFTDWLG